MKRGHHAAQFNRTRPSVTAHPNATKSDSIRAHSRFLGVGVENSASSVLVARYSCLLLLQAFCASVARLASPG
jgi:hypothetical protein